MVVQREALVSDITVYVDQFRIVGDPDELRTRYVTELREDGMIEASDEKLVEWCFEQNPQMPELEVDAW